MPAPRDVAIVGVHSTTQGRNLGRSGLSLEMEAFRGALADAGMTHHDVDGWISFDFPAGNGQGWVLPFSGDLRQVGGVTDISYFTID